MSADKTPIRNVPYAEDNVAYLPMDDIVALIGERRLKPTDTLLLIAFLAHQGPADGAEARPSQQTLADSLGRSVRTVQRGLKRLEETGLIARPTARRKD